MAEIRQDPFVALGPGYGLRSLTDALFREAGFRPRIAFESQDSHTARGLVSAGLGVSILPPGGNGPGRDVSPDTAIWAGSRSRWNPDLAFREIGLAWRERRSGRGRANRTPCGSSGSWCWRRVRRSWRAWSGTFGRLTARRRRRAGRRLGADRPGASAPRGSARALSLPGARPWRPPRVRSWPCATRCRPRDSGARGPRRPPRPRGWGPSGGGWPGIRPGRPRGRGRTR